MEDWQVKEFTLTAVPLLSERTDDDSWQGRPDQELYLYLGTPIQVGSSLVEHSVSMDTAGGAVATPQSDDLVNRRFAGELNGPQQNRLRGTCQYIDRLLSDIEHVLHQATSQSPFPRYIIDVAPAQARVMEGHIQRLRAELLRALDWQRMKPHPPDIPATRAVLTDLAFIDIAVEELRPRYMRGSGVVPDDAVDELNGVVRELRSLVEAMERYVRQTCL